MVGGTKILSVRFRALAQATELEERVLNAMAFASGVSDASVSSQTGHFGNAILVIETELARSAQICQFFGRMAEAGVLKRLAAQAEERTDEECVFHFRLAKQEAFQERLELAEGRDAIDVRVRVGVYPAKRAAAVTAISNWLSQFDAPPNDEAQAQTLITGHPLTFEGA
jgi:RNA binding exosome subunit